MRAEPMGLERLKEALEANDWDGGEELGEEINFDDIDDFGEEDDESLGFGIDPKEMEEEMKGMKQAIYRGGMDGIEKEVEVDEEQDEEVEKLQAMMLKMQAVRGKFL
jgi:hypothetical protein